MKAARSFILHDEAFGLIGAGCLVEENGRTVKVTPKDGLRKTVVYPEKKLRVVLTQGEVDWLTLDGKTQEIELSVVDTTGLVKTASLHLDGLASGKYRIRHGSSQRSVDVSGRLELSMPIRMAKASLSPEPK